MLRAAQLTLVAVVALVVLVGPGANPASAHRGKESYLYLDVSTNDLEGRAEFPYEDIRDAFGLSLDGTTEEVRAEIADNLAMLQAYADEHTSIAGAGRTWDLDFGDDFQLLSDLEEEEELGYAIFPFTVDLGGDAVPRQLDITFDPFLDELPDRRAIVLVANDWQRGVFDEEANELRFFDPDSRSGQIDLGNPSQWLNFTGSVRLGVDHIETGPDHIFFVLVLLAPSVLVFLAGAWHPTDSFGSALWRILKIVSMFTVAHSITFTLAGLELLPLPPSRLVESIIALSIAAAALHNLRPVLRNREWLISFLFGLFHGMGFASLVETLDVGRTDQLVSLMGRNVGIEIGQAIVVLMVFPTLFLLRRTRFYRPLFVAGSLLLAAISLMWSIERILGYDFDMNRFIEPAVDFPRSLYVMIVVTIIAFIIREVESRAGRLLPVASDVEAAGSGNADELTPAALAD